MPIDIYTFGISFTLLLLMSLSAASARFYGWAFRFALATAAVGSVWARAMEVL